MSLKNERGNSIESVEDIAAKVADLVKQSKKLNTDNSVIVKRRVVERAKTNEIIKNANNLFLLDVLSPEIKANEERKRKHKDWLMFGMGAFLGLQFLIVGIMVIYSGYYIIDCHVNKIPFSDSTIKIIFAFIGTYITSVIIELIAILKYIVINVFDTSITGMVNNFKDGEKKEE